MSAIDINVKSEKNPDYSVTFGCIKNRMGSIRENLREYIFTTPIK
jgi:hypothetical protein